MIEIKCACGKAIQLKDELAGKRIKCPGCAAVLAVPAPAGARAQRVPVAQAVPAAAAAAPKSRAARKKGEPPPLPENITCGHCRRVIPGTAVACPHCGSMTMTAVKLSEVSRTHAGPGVRQWVSRLIWLVVIVAVGFLAWIYGNKGYDWLMQRGSWASVAGAIEAEPSSGDGRLFMNLEAADKLGDALDPLLAKKWAQTQDAIQKQRILTLLTYEATQRPLSQTALDVLQEGLGSNFVTARDWALKGIALAAGAEQAYAVLLPFPGKAKFELKPMKKSPEAASILKGLTIGSELDYDLMVTAAQVTAGQTQALSNFKTLLEPEKNRGRVKDMLSRLTGQTFQDAAQFTAWWEGADGAYQRKRPDWLIEALDKMPSDQHLAIITQLRAVSGKNFNYNRAAAEDARMAAIQSWKNWWAAEKSRY